MLRVMVEEKVKSFLYPCKTNVFGGILESACLYVCVYT